MASKKAPTKIVAVKRKKPKPKPKTKPKAKPKLKRIKSVSIQPAIYNLYIYKVLKQVQPELSLTNQSMIIINQFCRDMFDRIAREASRLCIYSQRLSLSAREVQTATQLVLPGELSKHAISEGGKHVNKYYAAVDSKGNRTLSIHSFYIIFTVYKSI